MRVRTFEQLIEDCVWPGSGFGPPEDRRHEAIAEVLCRIPESDYRTLVDSIDEFSWFIPASWNRAGVFPFPCIKREAGNIPEARVLYLGPQLEDTAWDILVAIVAHELAHLVLHDDIVTKTPDQYNAQEEAAFSLVCQWGFEREAKKHRAGWRRYDSREKAMIAQLKQKG